MFFKELKQFKIGLEREALRLNHLGKPAITPHPAALGSKLTHPNFTTDFAENQIEFVTPPFSSIERALTFLETLHRAFYTFTPDEKLWPHSMPPKTIKDIPIADFGVSSAAAKKNLYRLGLTQRYPIEMQLISGIHANYSFPDAVFKKLGLSKNEGYMALIRNFLRHGWILTYLFGASTSKKYPNSTSLRVSPLGYYSRVQSQMAISFNSIEEYLQGLDKACTTPHTDYQKIDPALQLNPNTLQIPAEHYTRIRPKSQNGNLSKGIDYIEVRSLDLNPNSPIGIEQDALEFLHIFLLHCLLEPSPPLTKHEQKQICEHQAHVALYGTQDTDPTPLLTAMEPLADYLGYKDMPNPQRALTPLKSQEKSHFAQLAEKSLKDQQALELKEFELSTLCLIDAAKKRNISIEILDRPHNIIRLNNKVIVQQATCTHKDTYIAPLLMDNKSVTKKLLQEHNLKTPSSQTFNTLQEALAYTPKTKIVIKPNTANFGVGISFISPNQPAQYSRAIKAAFKHASSVLIEEFCPGDEIRFLVIDNKVVAVTLREPANITGNGIHTMRQLIKEKNQHKFPKEQIRLDKTLPLSSIPKKKQKIYLRENSNISTGGDAIDLTDTIHTSYSNLALKATQALGATICGVDMLIPNHKKPGPYNIIELNYNPQLSMHIYPTQGKPRPVCEALLEYLDL